MAPTWLKKQKENTVEARHCRPNVIEREILHIPIVNTQMEKNIAVIETEAIKVHLQKQVLSDHQTQKKNQAIVLKITERLMTPSS